MKWSAHKEVCELYNYPGVWSKPTAGQECGASALAGQECGASTLAVQEYTASSLAGQEYGASALTGQSKHIGWPGSKHIG